MSEPALTGRHALITGGSRGIGAAVARALGTHGARLTLIGRDEARLRETADALRGLTDVSYQVAHVESPEEVRHAFALAREAHGPADILINNAGSAESASFDKTDLELWHRMLAVNLTGTYLCTRAVLPAMRERGWGRIVNVASTAGLVGYFYVSAYCAAKHGVVGLTRSLALETAKSGVTVNAVCPGYTETDMVADAVRNIVEKTGRSADEARASLASRNPQGRLIRPEEVANAVAWLCLPGSEGVTGQAIAIAGGEVMTG